MKAYDSLADGFREKVGEVCVELGTMGIICIVTSGRRTIAEQNKLYQQGRTTPGQIVTKARGGESPHNFGLGADLCPYKPGTKELWWTAPDDIWHAIADVAKSRGLVAGYYWSNFQDKPHVEDPDWRKTRDAWKRGEIEVS